MKIKPQGFIFILVALFHSRIFITLDLGVIITSIISIITTIAYFELYDHCNKPKSINTREEYIHENVEKPVFGIFAIIFLFLTPTIAELISSL